MTAWALLNKLRHANEEQKIAKKSSSKIAVFLDVYSVDLLQKIITNFLWEELMPTTMAVNKYSASPGKRPRLQTGICKQIPDFTLFAVEDAWNIRSNEEPVKFQLFNGRVIKVRATHCICMFGHPIQRLPSNPSWKLTGCKLKFTSEFQSIKAVELSIWNGLIQQLQEIVLPTRGVVNSINTFPSCMRSTPNCTPRAFTLNEKSGALSPSSANNQPSTLKTNFMLL